MYKALTVCRNIILHERCREIRLKQLFQNSKRKIYAKIWALVFLSTSSIMHKEVNKGMVRGRLQQAQECNLSSQTQECQLSFQTTWQQPAFIITETGAIWS